MTAWPSASTRLLAVLGHPVRHSLSPAIHNAALRSQGLDLLYVALEVAPARLLDAVRGLGAAGFVGANVTIPHKQAVVAACDDVSEDATLVDAVNTLRWDDQGRLHGDNTDIAGLRRALDEVDAPTGPAVVLGTGGASRAAVAVLRRRGEQVTVIGRDAAVADVVLGSPQVATVVAAADLVVNATPLGMNGEDLPAPFMTLRPSQVAYDLVYHPPVTPFLAAATANGAVAHNGLAMLLHQAAVAYELWTGRAAPLDVMRSAVGP